MTYSPFLLANPDALRPGPSGTNVTWARGTGCPFNLTVPETLPNFGPESPHPIIKRATAMEETHVAKRALCRQLFSIIVTTPESVNPWLSLTTTTRMLVLSRREDQPENDRASLFGFWVCQNSPTG